MELCGTSQAGNLHHGAFSLSLLLLLGPFLGMIGLICLLKQRERGHKAMDNPIYGFAIYYKFL